MFQRLTLKKKKARMRARSIVEVMEAESAYISSHAPTAVPHCSMPLQATFH